MDRSIINIKDFEAAGQHNWTDSFRRAVKALEENGGGRLYVPAGMYETASIRLKSHMELYLEMGATLLFTDRKEEYEIITTGFEGKDQLSYMPCIYAKGEENVAVSGCGTINGQGSAWWKEVNSLSCRRPCLICFEECRHVRLQDVTLLNSPAWTVHPLFCDDVVIQGISIRNPADSPNTDGINPDCSSNVRITGCMIDVGDDCIAIKAGTEESEHTKPCENIVVTGCHMIRGHGGVVIGSEMSGSVRNVVVSDCVFHHTDRGIRLKTRRKRGGAMERLIFHHIVMDHVICPFVFNMYYSCGDAGKMPYVSDKTAHQLDETTPAIRDVMIDHITVHKAAAAAGFCYGLPESPIERLTVTECVIEMDPSGTPGHPAMMEGIEPVSAAGFFMRHVKGAVMERIVIKDCAGPEIDSDETTEYIRR